MRKIFSHSCNSLIKDTLSHYLTILIEKCGKISYSFIILFYPSLLPSFYFPNISNPIYFIILKTFI